MHILFVFIVVVAAAAGLLCHFRNSFRQKLVQVDCWVSWEGEEERGGGEGVDGGVGGDEK